MTRPALSLAILIVAAGRGQRAGEGKPKQYRMLAGRPVLSRTLQRFRQAAPEATIGCVVHPDDLALYRAATADSGPLLEPVMGGDTRQQSVLNGLRALARTPPRIILIHDAARPLIPVAGIQNVIKATGPHMGAIAATPMLDSLKRATGGDVIAASIDRDRIWAAQTPQGFPFAPLLAAHEHAAASGLTVTDDAAIAEAAGLPVRLIDCGPGNIKLTRTEDFADAERRLMTAALPDIRVGHGYDVHAFEPGDGVMLGGILIAHDRKLKGHSDADVALHTITDAVYGAIADGDIGRHFPPSDPQWKGAASDRFLRHAVERVAARGGRITSVDLTVICEQPRIGPHSENMRARIAAIMAVSPDRVSVKATTTEQLGFTGRGEGIAASATVTVVLPGSAD